LTATEVTTTSAVVSWTAPEDYEAFYVRYGVVNGEELDTVEVSADTFYTLTNLTPNSAYAWAVQNLCDNGRISTWVSAAEDFTTLNSAIEDLRSASGIKVYASGKQINVLNQYRERIESVVLTSVNGAVLQRHAIRGRDNVLVTTTLQDQIVVVSVYGKNGIIKNEKVFIK
jgi:hypothetical protein